MSNLVWFVASVPFWLFGLLMLGGASWGMYKIGQSPLGCPQDRYTWDGVMGCFTISMIMLPLAAFIATRGM